MLRTVADLSAAGTAPQQTAATPTPGGSPTLAAGAKAAKKVQLSTGSSPLSSPAGMAGFGASGTAMDVEDANTSRPKASSPQSASPKGSTRSGSTGGPKNRRRLSGSIAFTPLDEAAENRTLDGGVKIEHALWYEWRRNGTIVLLDTDPDKLRRFGSKIECGTRFTITKGRSAGISGKIIGLRNGYLWRHDDGVIGASAFIGTNEAELMEHYGLAINGYEDVYGCDPPKEDSSAAQLHAIIRQQEEKKKKRQVIGPKAPFVYVAPYGDSATVVQYEIHSKVMEAYGFRQGDVVLMQKGLREGQTALIIGVYQGRLHRQHPGEAPRPFMPPGDTINENMPKVIGHVSVEEYPKEKYKTSKGDFLCDESYMDSTWGWVHRQRVQHRKGERKGTFGVIMGVLGQRLYEFNEAACEYLELIGSTPREIMENHELRVVGAYVGPLLLPRHPPKYFVGGREFDVRCSVCAELGYQHGQALKVVLGPRYNRLGRFIGVSRGLGWCIFTAEEGPVPMTFQEEYVPIYKPIESILDNLDPAPNQALIYPNCFGFAANFDISHAACEPFDLYHGQRVVIGIRGVIAVMADPLHEAKLPEMSEGWCLATVLGVFRHELWVLKDSESVGSPLKGCCAMDLATNYVTAVIGWDQLTLQAYNDMYLPPHGALQTDTITERVLQNKADMVLYTLRESDVIWAFGTSEAAFHLVDERLNVRHGDRVCSVPRIPPKVTKRVVDGVKQEEWTWFGEKIWLTVLGVAHRIVHVVYDDNPTACVPVTVEDVLQYNVVENDTSRLVFAEPEHWRLLPTKDSVEVNLGEEHIVFPHYHISAVNTADVVVYAATKVTDAQLKEMWYKFYLIPQSVKLLVLEWVLSCYNVDLGDGEGITAALKKLVAIQDGCGQRVEAPNKVQWGTHLLDKVTTMESSKRDDMEHDERSIWLRHLYEHRIVMNRLASFHLAPDDEPALLSESAALEKAPTMSPQETPRGSKTIWGKAVGKIKIMGALSMQSTRFALHKAEERLAQIKQQQERDRLCRDADEFRLDFVMSSALDILLTGLQWPFKYTRVTGETIWLDISMSVCKPFGYFHGQQLRYTKGDLKGETCTIVGVYQRRLWRYDGTDGELQPLGGANQKEIYARHRFAVAGIQSSVRCSDVFFFHTSAGEVTSFSVADSDMKPFGVAFGQRYTSSTHREKRVLIVIVGVREGRVWYSRDWCGAVSFDGQNIKQELNLKYLYTSDATTLMDTYKRFRDEGRPDDRRCIVFPVGSSAYNAFDVSFEACKPFGVFPGQHVVQLKNGTPVQSAMVVGVRHGRLFRQVQGDRGATPYEGTAQNFQDITTLKIVKWVRPSFMEINADNCVARNARLQRFKFIAVIGEVCLFDVRESECMRLFGLKTLQRVSYKPIGREHWKIGTVVGVRFGMLWKVDDGDNHATMFHGSYKRSDLLKYYEINVVGTGKLREHVG